MYTHSTKNKYGKQKGDDINLIFIGGKPFQAEGDTFTPLDTTKIYEIKSTKMDARTLKQNRALYKYFTLVSEALNGAGLDIKEVIKADVAWTPQTVKTLLWAKLQKVLLNTKSTTQLKKKDIDTVFHTMNRVLGEKYGIYVPFPSEEELNFGRNYE